MDRRMKVAFKWAVIITVGLIAGIMAGAFTSGCKTHTYIEGRYPVAPTLDRPQLQVVMDAELAPLSAEVRAKVRANQTALMDYARKLEIALKELNDYAEKRNKESGFSTNDD